MTNGTEMPVGVIGLGMMGMGVARSLLRAGFAVSGYDPRGEASNELAAHGGYAARSPAEVGARSETVVILVVDAAQTEEALFGCDGIAAAMPAGSIVITSSTVPPEFAADLAHRLNENGLLHIDAPVSGG